MALIDKLTDRSRNRCEICGKPLTTKKPAILKLFSSGIGIRQSALNCLVACDSMVEELRYLTVSEKVLFVINKQDPIVCKFKVKATPTPSVLKKLNSTQKAKKTKVHWFATNIYFGDSNNKARPPKEKRLKNPPPVFLDKNQNSRYEFSEGSLEEKVQTVTKEERLQYWKTALGQGTLPLRTINKLLEQANFLALSDQFVNDLQSAIKNKKFLAESNYLIDKGGVVFIKN